MRSTSTHQPRKGEFFKLRPDATRGGKGHGVVFDNEDALLATPRLILLPEAGGFPPLRETPRLVYRERQGVPPQDLEGGLSGYWLVSERLRQVMEEIDPDAFVFADTDYRLEDGSKGPTYFLCDVVRTLDALDEEASQLKIVISDEYKAGKYYRLTGDVRLAFKREVLGSAHVFRLPFHGGVLCDRTFKDAVEAAGIVTAKRSNGLWFEDVVNCSAGPTGADFATDAASMQSAVHASNLERNKHMPTLERNQPALGEFYLLMPDTTRRGRGHGVEIENEDALLTPPRLIIRPEEGGIPHLAQRPRLVLDPKLGDPPQDLEGGMSGYWLVSERLKKAFTEIDPVAFEFVECDYVLPDGTEGPTYYLCEVVRELDAVDEEASKFRVIVDEGYPGGKFYDLRGGASLAFKREVIRDSHVFRSPYSGDLVYCDRMFRDAIRAAGIGSECETRGLRFKDAANV